MPPKAKNNKRLKQTISTSNENKSVENEDSSVSSQDSLPPKKKIKPSTEIDANDANENVSHHSHLHTPGQVLTVGQGDVGQLGLGEDVMERKYPQTVCDGDIQGKSVIQVTCGGMHTVALSEDGNVYSWGCNDEGALGRPSDESNEFDPMKVQLPDGTKVVQICAGDSHTAALSSTGSVFVWGVFRDSNGPFGLINDKPCPLPQLVYNNRVNPAVKIASGSDHLFFLTLDGSIISIGCGEQGQLGRIHEYFSFRGGRKGIKVLLTPAQVKFKKTRGVPQPKFCDVFCGSYHTFALTADRKHIYGWGLNNYGQLGTGDVDNRFQPERLSGPWDSILEEGLKDLCGGQHHSVLCTTKGSVYTLGRSEYGRLGLGDDTKEASYPERVPVLSDVLSVAAGTCVSFALNKHGQAYSWGMGTNYQLSSGSEDDQLSPLPMSGKNLADKDVLSISSGGQHTALLVCNKTK